MKVTRDFYTDKVTGAAVYEWHTVVDGTVFAYRHAVERFELMYRGHSPLEYLERTAQHAIAASIRKELFGDRAL